MSPVWRLIADGPVRGATNMALDRAVQLACDEGSAPPTLRLYRWVRPTVTLGRFQPVDGVDLDACAELGVDVVRRYTGGRGVLHDDELTYSIVAGVADGVPRGVAASYRHLCGGLAAAYGLLGVDAQLTARARGDRTSPACYLHATSADLSLGAMKLSGSAQVWYGDTVLQHGSFTVSRDVARESRLFRLTPDEAARLAEQTATLEDALGARPTPEQLADAVARGVAQTLGVTLEPGTYSARELQIAEETLVATDVTLPLRRGVRP